MLKSVKSRRASGLALGLALAGLLPVQAIVIKAGASAKDSPKGAGAAAGPQDPPPTGATQPLVETKQAATGTSGAAALADPVVTAIEPPAAGPGETVTLAGSNLDRVERVSFLGSGQDLIFRRQMRVDGKVGPLQASPTRLSFTLPLEWARPMRNCRACEGGFTLDTRAAGAGLGACVSVPADPAFTLLPPGPLLTGFQPVRGEVGTRVVLTGHFLDDRLSEKTEVAFGGIPAQILETIPTRILALVPAEARTGPLTVRRGTRTQACGSYTVRDASSPTALHLAAMHLTQATQTLDGKVPLVQGRDACLRVFALADGGNSAEPVVRVSLWNAEGAMVLREHVRAQAAGVPLSIDPLSATESFNTRIPGQFIQQGCSVLAELLPFPGGEALASFPPGGVAMPLEVVVVPPVRIALIPVRSPYGLAQVTGPERSLEDWLQAFRKVMPVAEVEVREGPLLDLSTVKPADPRQAMRIFRAHLLFRRAQEGPQTDEYQVAVMTRPELEGSSHLGLTFTSATRTAIICDGSQEGFEEAQWTLAHELGHLFDREHSPCGEASEPDPHYPVAGGFLDEVGFDVQTLTAIDPKLHTDFMGYGERNWVSRYTWEGVLTHLTGLAAEGKDR